MSERPDDERGLSPLDEELVDWGAVNEFLTDEELREIIAIECENWDYFHGPDGDASHYGEGFDE